MAFVVIVNFWNVISYPRRICIADQFDKLGRSFLIPRSHRIDVFRSTLTPPLSIAFRNSFSFPYAPSSLPIFGTAACFICVPNHGHLFPVRSPAGVICQSSKSDLTVRVLQMSMNAKPICTNRTLEIRAPIHCVWTRRGATNVDVQTVFDWVLADVVTVGDTRYSYFTFYACLILSPLWHSTFLFQPENLHGNGTIWSPISQLFFDDNSIWVVRGLEWSDLSTATSRPTSNTITLKWESVRQIRQTLSVYWKPNDTNDLACISNSWWSQCHWTVTEQRLPFLKYHCLHWPNVMWIGFTGHSHQLSGFFV